MPKRKDENETAFSGLQELLKRGAARDGIPQQPTAEPEKVPYRVKAGRKGGKKGGKARAKALSSRKRKAIARKGAMARWKRARS